MIASGSGNNGTLNGTTFIDALVPGVYGNSLQLDGTNDYINVTRTSQLPGGGDDFTLAFWLAANDWDNETGVVASYNWQGIAFNVGLSTAVDSLLVNTNFGAERTYNIPVGSFADGVFHHFAIVFQADDGVTDIYVDGVRAADSGSSNAFNFNTTQSFLIGRSELFAPQGNLLAGKLDDLVIIDRALAAGEIGDVVSGSRLFHLQLEETDGSRLDDASPYNNIGTLFGTDMRDAGDRGQFGQAVRLDGVNDYIRIDNVANLPERGEVFTASFWLSVDDWAGESGVVASYELNGMGWNIGLDREALLVGATFGDNREQGVDVSGLTNGEFAHFAAVFSPDAGIEVVYINGQPVPERFDNSFRLHEDDAFTIGGRIPTSEPGYLEGIIDDFAIFDRRLNSAELERIMTSGAGALHSPSGGASAGAGAAIGTSSFEAGAGTVLLEDWDQPHAATRLESTSTASGSTVNQNETPAGWRDSAFELLLLDEQTLDEEEEMTFVLIDFEEQESDEYETLDTVLAGF